MTATITPAADTTTTANPGRDSRARRWARRLARVAALMLVVALVLGLTGAAFQVYATSRDAFAHPPPGEVVEVAGHDLHLHVSGEQHTDEPTVILESGMGPAFSTAWAWIQPEIAEYARVVSYDRPGLGWSEPTDRGTDPHAMAADLHAALDRLGIDGPYLLVSHSLGGFHSRVFAATYPEEVAGLLLVDPAHEDQWERFPQEVLDAEGPYRTMLNAVPVLARLGVTRVVHPFETVAGSLPASVRDEAIARINRVEHATATRDEYAAFERIGDAAASAGDLGDLPVRIISAGQEPTMPTIVAARQRLHEQLAADLSTDGDHSVVDAGHVELVSEREPAMQVADAVRGLWTDVR